MIRPGTTPSVRVTAPFADMLSGGHPNSLGRTSDAVGIVLADPDRLGELFATMADPEELVRMRVGGALDKICRERPSWFVPHIERLLDELGNIDQPSVQRHVARAILMRWTSMTWTRTSSRRLDCWYSRLRELRHGLRNLQAWGMPQ